MERTKNYGIELKRYKIFNSDPSERFAKIYGVDKKIVLELWSGYQMLGLNSGEIRKLFYYKTGKILSPKSWSRWIKRMEVYLKAQKMMSKKISLVNAESFNPYESFVTSELNRGRKRRNLVSSANIEKSLKTA